MFHACSGVFTHIEVYLPTLRFRHIQDPGITDSSNVKQHLLFKSGSSFKSLFRSIWNNFFIFDSKVNIQKKFFQDSISAITVKIIIACHPC